MKEGHTHTHVADRLNQNGEWFGESGGERLKTKKASERMIIQEFRSAILIQLEKRTNGYHFASLSTAI
ncbi:hypothetical protein ANTQUA_LOCUS3086 [Anthophora quadrimaculata]